MVSALRTCLALLLAGLGQAQEPLPPQEPAPAETPSARETASGGDADDEDQGFRPLRVQLRGRLLARAEWYSEGDSDDSDYTLEDVRAELRWRPARWLRGELSGDAAGNRYLRDAFLRFRFGAWGVRVGQFKQPSSAVQMDTRWDLPSTERGLVSDVLVDAIGLGARRSGVQLQYRRDGEIRVRARGGVFRASHVRGDRIGDEGFDNLADDWSFDAHKLAGRLSFDRNRLEIGLFGEWRPAQPVPGRTSRRFWAGGADLKWSDRPKRGGRRLWLEGFVGSSWQDDDAFDGEDAVFLGARLIGAYRLGGRRQGARYVEPYVTVGLVDPDASIRQDVMWEILCGLNAGCWDRLRLTLELQHRSVAANAPLSLGLFTWDWMPPPASRTGIRVQIGGAVW
jgi:hypothetical protein